MSELRKVPINGYMGDIPFCKCCKDHARPKEADKKHYTIRCIACSETCACKACVDATRNLEAKKDKAT